MSIYVLAVPSWNTSDTLYTIHDILYNIHSKLQIMPLTLRIQYIPIRYTIWYRLYTLHYPYILLYTPKNSGIKKYTLVNPIKNNFLKALQALGSTFHMAWWWLLQLNQSWRRTLRWLTILANLLESFLAGWMDCEWFSKENQFFLIERWMAFLNSIKYFKCVRSWVAGAVFECRVVDILLLSYDLPLNS